MNMKYTSKGYAPLNESKKAKDIQVVFLSSRAEKTTKSIVNGISPAAHKSGLSDRLPATIKSQG